MSVTVLKVIPVSTAVQGDLFRVNRVRTIRSQTGLERDVPLGSLSRVIDRTSSAKGKIVALTERAFELLHQLTENNNREWFHANKDEFKSEVFQPFEQVLEAISAKLAGTAIPFAGCEHTMFRMNRDVRFSKDKSPYKTSVSGLMTPSGAKSEDAGVIYLCLDAFGGFVAGGFHNPDGPNLTKMRDQIVARPEAFKKLVASLQSSGLELETDGALKRVPR